MCSSAGEEGPFEFSKSKLPDLLFKIDCDAYVPFAG
jgi:hypothetical protein